MHKYIAPPSVDMIVSDHFAISCDFCFEKPKYETREISYRKLDNIDMNGLETIYAKFHVSLAPLLTLILSSMNSILASARFLTNMLQNGSARKRYVL